MHWIIHKFGGSSLSDPAAFATVGSLLGSLDEPRQAVVVSAMAGTTNALIALAETAAAKDEAWNTQFEALTSRHLECATALDAGPELIDRLQISFARLRHILEALELLGSLPKEALDLIPRWARTGRRGS